MRNLKDLAQLIVKTKVMTADAVDGNIVGVDSVSGDDYFQTMPCIGTVYVDTNGLHKVVVDVIAYPAHTSDSGKFYKAENRMVVLTFNPDTLEIGPKRDNVGYDAMAKHLAKGRVLSIDIASYVNDRVKAIEDKKRKEAEAKARAERLARAKAEEARREAEYQAYLAQQAYLKKVAVGNSRRTAINNLF